MRIISINLDGIHNATERGFTDWISEQEADVICVQNLRAQESQLGDQLLQPHGYEGYFFDALEGDQIAGVGIYCKSPPKAIMTGLGFEMCDYEGRYIQADYEHVSIGSILFPPGSSNHGEQQKKFQFMEGFMSHLKKTRRKRREFIFCGSFHIAHKTIDLSDWQGNQTEPGFLAEERAWLDQVFGPVGFIDAFREANIEDKQFTWWPSTENARRNTLGWRVDYQITTPGLKDQIANSQIDRDANFSSHAPVIIDYSFE